MKSLVAALAVLATCALANRQHDLFEATLKKSMADGGNTWVVLVAGSTGWDNYRHQSSVCKAYQLAHRAGVPDERIITFMMDDIANNTRNPFPGQIFNELYVEGGDNFNVYEGVVKDYVGSQATAKNLVKVLSGVPTSGGSGKILRSTSNDNVFVYYDDHGGPGIVAMPTGSYFRTENLVQVFDAMKQKQMYKNMIFFVSACYSGSLFYKTEIPENVYVATSAPIAASSYACLHDSKLRTYVTSCWPHGWIHSIDEHGLKVDFGTIFEDSYHYAKNNSPTLPCQYGDLELKQKTFLGFLKDNDFISASRRPATAAVEHDSTAVPQYLVPFALAKDNYEHEPTEENLRAYKAEAATRLAIDAAVQRIVDAVMPGNKFVAMATCDKCDESCPCYSDCIKFGSDDHCSRACCNYAACNTKNSKVDAAETEFALALESAFLASLPADLANHAYALSSGVQFNRLCRSGVDVSAAIRVIRANAQ